ncbi:hypothetical protein [Paraburkholderia sp. J11-2]|uniref:hypothetical protein n=1 Tax=Paraburkholderia sp. J11-2 TaxID=2805431 RepID=UPI002AB64242|nr:hypothetical protein [Paraburkholderia sp. J11-2]
MIRFAWAVSLRDKTVICLQGGGELADDAGLRQTLISRRKVKFRDGTISANVSPGDIVITLRRVIQHKTRRKM